MEIERKFTVNKDMMPELDNYNYHKIEQAYLNTDPVVRIRKQDDEYILTYKGGGHMVREEYNLLLNKKSYKHLLKKADGNVITKKRYLIPFDPYTIELDVFEGAFNGLIMAEIEFPTEEEAVNATGPEWFLKDVTFTKNFHNSKMSRMSADEIKSFINENT